MFTKQKIVEMIRNKEITEELKEYFSREEVDLSGSDLSGTTITLNFCSCDLSDANLSDASLSGADLRRANLSGANLIGANLRRANLIDANLIDADLIDANLIDADLRRANLSGADLRRADLSGANLIDANLLVLILPCYTAYVQKETTRIGCQNHSNSDWLAFDDERISKMAGNALTFWKKFKPLIQQAMETLDK